MIKPEVAKSETQKAPYVRPAIVTLKVDLAVASSATELGQLLEVVNVSQALEPAEMRERKANAAGSRVKNQS